jgi:hypothetical protein
VPTVGNGVGGGRAFETGKKKRQVA